MKKILALLLAAMMLFCFVACNTGDNPDPNKDNPGTSQNGGGNNNGGENNNGSENNGGESIAWPENEFTALIPKPKTGTIAEESSFDNLYFKGINITLTNWSVEDCKAYAEELMAAGFTQPGAGFDSVVVKDDGSDYSFGATNADGVYVTVGTNVERKIGGISIQITK